MPALKAVNMVQQFALRQPTHHLVIDGLGDWVPRLVVLHMAMVGVVCPMADPPAVVGHQDGAVHNVAHQVIDLAAIAEALVPAAHHAQESGCAPAYFPTFECPIHAVSTVKRQAMQGNVRGL